jgi:hypothetical protein
MIVADILTCLLDQTATLDGGKWTSLMTADYFGSNDPITGRILDGRWANITVPYVTNEFLEKEGVSTTSTFFPSEEREFLRLQGTPHMYSPYGLLRSPWNYNPTTYVTRYNNVDRISDISNIDSYFYNGVTCSDYNTFINEMKDKPLEMFLKDVEDGTHGYFHFTIAGTGGDFAQSTNDEFRDTYSFTDANIVVTDDSSHDFFKNYVTWQKTYADDSSVVKYLNCTNDAWDPITQTLKTTANPGEADGPTCSCNSAVLSSETDMNTMLETLYKDWIDDDDSVAQEYETYDKVMSLSTTEKAAYLSSLCSRYLIEGDLAGSGSAMDPMFWVAHGAVEKLYQKMNFESWLSDSSYVAFNDGACSGHDANGTKSWLDGLSFIDTSVDVKSLTNTEIMAILNPNSDSYRDYINFIYDHSDWSTICEDEGITLFGKH